jgi:hypothetical protein
MVVWGNALQEGDGPIKLKLTSTSCGRTSLLKIITFTSVNY